MVLKPTHKDGTMKHHPRPGPPVVGIPEDMLHNVCKLHQVGACAFLVHHHSDSVWGCTLGTPREAQGGVTATGTQYLTCEGPPLHDDGRPWVPVT